MNKLEGHSEICTKTQLALNMRAYAKAIKVDLSDLVPATVRATCIVSRFVTFSIFVYLFLSAYSGADKF